MSEGRGGEGSDKGAACARRTRCDWWAGGRRGVVGRGVGCRTKTSFEVKSTAGGD